MGECKVLDNDDNDDNEGQGTVDNEKRAQTMCIASSGP